MNELIVMWKRERERELFRSEKDGVSREVYIYTCERVHLVMMIFFFFPPVLIREFSLSLF